MYQLIGTIAVQLLVAVFVYGKLSERNKVHTEQIQKLETKTDKHDGELGVVYGTLRLKR
jgi:hypothetical protein